MAPAHHRRWPYWRAGAEAASPRAPGTLTAEFVLEVVEEPYRRARPPPAPAGPGRVPADAGQGGGHDLGGGGARRLRGSPRPRSSADRSTATTTTTTTTAPPTTASTTTVPPGPTLAFPARGDRAPGRCRGDRAAALAGAEIKAVDALFAQPADGYDVYGCDSGEFSTSTCTGTGPPAGTPRSPPSSARPDGWSPRCSSPPTAACSAGSGGEVGGGDGGAVGPVAAEPGAVGSPFDPVAAFVDEVVVMRAEQAELVEVGVPALVPRFEVMGFTQPGGAVHPVNTQPWSRMTRARRWAGVTVRSRRPRSKISERPRQMTRPIRLSQANRRAVSTADRTGPDDVGFGVGVVAGEGVEIDDHRHHRRGAGVHAGIEPRGPGDQIDQRPAHPLSVVDCTPSGEAASRR